MPFHRTSNNPDKRTAFAEKIRLITQQPHSKRFTFFIRYVIFAGILIPVIFSFYMGHDTFMKLIAANLRPDIIWVPFVAFLGIYFIDTWRLQIVLLQYGIRFRFIDGFYNSSLFLFMSHLTPGGSGGYPAQIFHLAKNGVDTKIAANLSLSRVVVLILACLLVVAVFHNTVADVTRSAGASIYLIYVGIAFFLFMTCLYFLLFVRSSLIHNMLEGVSRALICFLPGKADALHRLSKRLSVWTEDMAGVVLFLWREKFYIVLLDLVLTVVVLCLQTYSLYYILAALTSNTPSFTDLFVIFVTLNIFASLIPTPGGSGGIEWVYAFVLSGLTGQTEATMMAVLGWRFATYYLHLGFEALIFFGLPFSNPSLRKKTHDAR